MSDLRVFIGWDSRESEAYDVARHSLLRHASIDVEITPIKLPDLIDQGLYTRDVDPLASTEFTYSRFFTPYLAGFDGWALFFDCDFLWIDDVAPLLDYRDDSKAVFCVQHDYTPKETHKMDGQVQTTYPRKNWSSFLFFNAGHASVQQLTPDVVNRESGAFLHRMAWVDDKEIGSLPTAYNWLEGWNDVATDGPPRAVHFTRGGPWFKEWQDVDFGPEWLAEHDLAKAS
ncbi:glycosyltransferase [Roseobacter sp. HKCCD9010]|uniref:glycosyltransferase n=1 Tax=unclassified Roseobacter TaxID=196798 RepID=UPI001490DF0D|nr:MULTISPECIES: glycosyltransferase [unclassified Roseobacter]MBF9050614.1 glycosyltransferase [Rhodobacterales bacterium HKCCD4356]NNV11968.1 glycosyltransferase [Roseobacter sp. HKCCD7357]NNV16981.1 glycosyltransferase [Roseobacter sp. HKCCD8768]NNV26210.1 glycosyltransferase [Roseobacter sp. HKCCD8192]NNV30705.1 glycosyltransferase [Roseobacter sp. HKCCD9061]